MTMHTFKAPTMAEALQQLKSQMGTSAVILHTRTVPIRRWLGLRRAEMVEITATTELKPRAPRTPRPLLDDKLVVKPGPGIYGPGGRPVVKPDDKPKTFAETPAFTNTLLKGIVDEVNGLAVQVKRFMAEQDHQRKPQVPEELFEHYKNLVANEVADELAEDIVRCLKRDHRPECLMQDQFVRDKIIDQFDRLIPAAGPITRKRAAGPHIIALIGPTGVGKTTTLAKLAANLKLRDGHKVGLITLDTYRIAAVDQLKRYADIIGSKLKVVANSDELKDAVAAMADMDFVLLDTAGRSPKDVYKLTELRELLAAVDPDEVHLVLSSTAGQSCVELAVEKFSQVRVDRIIFTKLDEAAHIGLVLNVVRRLNKTLSYVTTGQDVPNDIEVGRGRILGQMMFDGVPKRLGYQPAN